MTRIQVKDFMERIKLHYQEFVIDEKRVEEWYKMLKDYDEIEVNEKLNEHLDNEQYGHLIPKVAFLVKYLTKISDKQKYNTENIKVKCNLCGATTSYSAFEKHLTRCNSVEYLNQQSLRLYEKEIDKEKYRNLDEETFNKIYDKVLMKILEITDNKVEKYMISQYFYGSNE